MVDRPSPRGAVVPRPRRTRGRLHKLTVKDRRQKQERNRRRARGRVPAGAVR